MYQAKNREVLEIVCSQEYVLAAHQRVSGMNFIPGGHVIPPLIRDARGEVESQLVEGHRSRQTHSRPLQIQSTTLKRRRTTMTRTSPQHHPSSSFKAVENGRHCLHLNCGPLPCRTLQTRISGNQKNCRSIFISLQAMN